MHSIREILRSLTPEPAYDLLRRSRTSRRVQRFGSYDVANRYGDWTYTMHIADPVAQEWYGLGWPNAFEVEFVRGLPLKGALVFDLGAHQCLVAMMLGRIVGPSGRVVAVEANAHNHAVAQRNLAANKASNVTCLRALVSSGRVSVGIDGGLNGRAHRTASPAPYIRTIDDLADEYGTPALVFMDIEGHEIEALGGASRTLASGAHWLIELHGDAWLRAYGHANADINRFFCEERYAAYKIDELTGAAAPLARAGIPHERCHLYFEARAG